MERKYYCWGLIDKKELICEENDCFRYISEEDGEQTVLHGKTRGNSMDLERNGEEFQNANDTKIERNVKRMLNEDGSRWEGDWYNGQPFGFGSYFDNDGKRIYTGFMFEGKKVVFGKEYFSNSTKVCYCGNFLNNLRHGFGTSYNENGKTLYEGEWRCGKNRFEDRMVIKNEEDCYKMHDLIKELEIGEGCLNDWGGSMVIKNYPNLEKITVKRKSLQYLELLKICDCERLKIIEIDDGIKEESIVVFYSLREFIIESIMFRIT